MRHHRPDGKLCRQVPDYRRVMPYLMRRRNESVFFAEQTLDLTQTERFIATHNMVAALKLMIAGSRGEEDGYTDRELALVLKLQGLPLRGLMGIERFADAFGLRIEDGMYAHEGLEHLKNLVEDPAAFIGGDVPRTIALPA